GKPASAARMAPSASPTPGTTVVPWRASRDRKLGFIIAGLAKVIDSPLDRNAFRKGVVGAVHTFFYEHRSQAFMGLTVELGSPHHPLRAKAEAGTWPHQRGLCSSTMIR